MFLLRIARGNRVRGKDRKAVRGVWAGGLEVGGGGGWCLGGLASLVGFYVLEQVHGGTNMNGMEMPRAMLGHVIAGAT